MKSSLNSAAANKAKHSDAFSFRQQLHKKYAHVGSVAKETLRYSIAFLLSNTFLAGCVTAPIPAKNQVSNCEISTDRLTLKVIDIAKETNSYYSVEGYVVSPILIPTTAILSGVYVLAHNTYRFGEEKIVCG